MLSKRAFFFCAMIFVHQTFSLLAPGKTEPCFPSDPEGENPGNLCLVYPTHGMSIHSDSFRQGFASDGFYGTRVGPNFPGTPLQPDHKPGTPLDPSEKVNGYWTRIEASKGETRLTTNTGKEWQLRLKN